MQPLIKANRNLEILSGDANIGKVVSGLMDSMTSLHQYLLAGMNNQTQLLVIAQSMDGLVNDGMISKIIDIIGEEFGGLNGLRGSIPERFNPLLLSSAKLLELIKRYYTQMVMINTFKESFTRGPMEAVLNSNPVEKVEMVLQNDSYIKMKFQYAIVKKRLVDEMSEFDTQYSNIIKYMNDAQELNAALVGEARKTVHSDLLARAGLLDSLRTINGAIINSATNLGQTTIIEREFERLQNVIASYEFTQLQFDPTFINPMRPITDLEDLYGRFNKTVLAIKNEGRGLDNFAKFLSGRDETEKTMADEIRLRAKLKTERDKERFSRVRGLVGQRNALQTKIVYTKGTVIPSASNILKCASENGSKLNRCIRDIEKRADVGSITYIRQLINLLMKKKQRSRKQGIYIGAISKLSKVLKRIESQQDETVFKSVAESAEVEQQRIMKKRKELDSKAAKLQKEIAEFNSTTPDVAVPTSLPMGVGNIGISTGRQATEDMEVDSPDNLIDGIYNSLISNSTTDAMPGVNANAVVKTLTPGHRQNTISMFAGGANELIIADTRKIADRIAESFGIVEKSATAGKGFIAELRRKLNEKYDEIIADESKSKDERIKLMTALRIKLAESLKKSSGWNGIDIESVTNKLSESTVKSIIYTLYSLNELAISAVESYIQRVYTNIKRFPQFTEITPEIIFGKYTDGNTIWVLLANLHTNRSIWRYVSAEMEKGIGVEFVKMLFDKVFKVGSKYEEEPENDIAMRFNIRETGDNSVIIVNPTLKTNMSVVLLIPPHGIDNAPFRHGEKNISIGFAFRNYVARMVDDYVKFVESCPVNLAEHYHIKVEEFTKHIGNDIKDSIFTDDKFDDDGKTYDGKKFITRVFRRDTKETFKLKFLDIIPNITDHSLLYTDKLIRFTEVDPDTNLLKFSDITNAWVSSDRVLNQISMDNDGGYDTVFKPSIDPILEDYPQALISNALRKEVNATLKTNIPEDKKESKIHQDKILQEVSPTGNTSTSINLVNASSPKVSADSSLAATSDKMFGMRPITPELVQEQMNILKKIQSNGQTGESRIDQDAPLNKLQVQLIDLTDTINKLHDNDYFKKYDNIIDQTNTEDFKSSLTKAKTVLGDINNLFTVGDTLDRLCKRALDVIYKIDTEIKTIKCMNGNIHPMMLLINTLLNQSFIVTTYISYINNNIIKLLTTIVNEIFGNFSSDINFALYKFIPNEFEVDDVIKQANVIAYNMHSAAEYYYSVSETYETNINNKVHTCKTVMNYKLLNIDNIYNSTTKYNFSDELPQLDATESDKPVSGSDSNKENSIEMFFGGAIPEITLSSDPIIQLGSAEGFDFAIREFKELLSGFGWEYLIGPNGIALKTNLSIEVIITEDREREVNEHYDYQMSVSRAANDRFVAVNKMIEAMRKDIANSSKYLGTIIAPLILAIIVAKNSNGILLKQLSKNKIFGAKHNKKTPQLSAKFDFNKEVNGLLDIYKDDLVIRYIGGTEYDKDTGMRKTDMFWDTDTDINIPRGMKNADGDLSGKMDDTIDLIKAEILAGKTKVRGVEVYINMTGDDPKRDIRLTSRNNLNADTEIGIVLRDEIFRRSDRQTSIHNAIITAIKRNVEDAGIDDNEFLLIQYLLYNKPGCIHNRINDAMSDRLDNSWFKFYKKLGGTIKATKEQNAIFGMELVNEE